MRECFHRARARKISLNNGASTPTFSLPIGKFRPQESVLKCLLLIRFAVCLQSYRISLQRKKRCHKSSVSTINRVFHGGVHRRKREIVLG